MGIGGEGGGVVWGSADVGIGVWRCGDRGREGG